MSFEIQASGNLAVAPTERAARGQQFLSMTVSCNVLNDEGGQETEWIDCMVMGPLMMRASRLKKGDGVWVRGHVTKRRYTQGNKERESWQMHVNELITHRETYES